MMKIASCILALASSTMAIAPAHAADCAAPSNATPYYPAVSYMVDGVKRVYFFNAPDERCPQKNVFVINGDSLNVYAETGAWYQVSYITKTGDTVEGWVKKEHLKYVGTLGPTDKRNK